MMIIRVLPIHVPPCYEGGYLKPLHWNHIWLMIHDDHLVWPSHVPRRCEPLLTPHLSLWGNARTRATFPTHKKSHNPHPQGGGGEGGQNGYITLGGVGGGLAKPGSYICVLLFFSYQPAPIKKKNVDPRFCTVHDDISPESGTKLLRALDETGFDARGKCLKSEGHQNHQEIIMKHQCFRLNIFIYKAADWSTCLNEHAVHYSILQIIAVSCASPLVCQQHVRRTQLSKIANGLMDGWETLPTLAMVGGRNMTSQKIRSRRHAVRIHGDVSNVMAWHSW